MNPLPILLTAAHVQLVNNPQQRLRDKVVKYLRSKPFPIKIQIENRCESKDVEECLRKGGYCVSIIKETNIGHSPTDKLLLEYETVKYLVIELPRK